MFLGLKSKNQSQLSPTTLIKRENLRCVFCFTKTDNLDVPSHTEGGVLEFL